MTAPPPARRRPAPWWLLPLAAMPLAWVLDFYLFVLRARLALGHWPRPMQPDPGTLGYHWHQTTVWTGLLSALSAMAFTTVFFIILPSLPRYRYPWGALAVFVVGSVGCAIVLFVDPGDLWSWYLD